jgi:hypothetical protein
MTPELKARVSIDALLVAAGWHLCNVANANIHQSMGVVIQEISLSTDFGFYGLFAPHKWHRNLVTYRRRNDEIENMGHCTQLDTNHHSMMVWASANLNETCWQLSRRPY